MKQSIVGGLAIALTAGALITSAPPASAGCRPGAPWAISQCDGPVQDDGTWQRCVTFNESFGDARSGPVYSRGTRCET